MTQLTIPSRFYTDENHYDFDKRQIFYKSWQFVGHVSQVANRGDYFTTKIVDENILIAKGEDEKIRAFFNVCPHRAHSVATGAGNRKLFVCPYHAWSYRLNGQLVRAPQAENVDGFCKNDIKLREVQLETMLGLIFVNLDDNATSLKETYPGLEEGILSTRTGIENMKPVFERDIEHSCNWKVSVENLNECYHCPSVHATSITQLYETESYSCDVYGPFMRHFIARKRDRDVHGDLHSWFIWPNNVVEVFPIHGAVSLRRVVPLGPSKTRYHYSWWVPEGLSEEATQEVVAVGTEYCNTVCREDAAVVACVQAGLESIGFDRGPLIVTSQAAEQSENAIAHFQTLYADTLKAAGEAL
ncbi:aromatic ring-hydroxylating oxygenase subunit alpha [Defluviimonas sp. SAOS-178_SWC]|uniref:aromatic ring-hydroxylating oxygenase subunit alpha n=1 Tax=Defluviimonas sp. SAOS-178_SWC TaxID=3121287 RepID=UPI0032218E59